MKFDTDVLIVGAGPSGLMMACQLARLQIPFRIIDKQADRAHESRAFGIQARSMEIFQNLGIVSEFLKRAMRGSDAALYFNGKMRVKLDFSQVDVKDTPFPYIFFLPQSETEQILIDHLAKHNIQVERQTELITFQQTQDDVQAEISNKITGKTEKIRCQYIVGCDGAHSTVRHTLNIPFVGASYPEEFVLADVTVQWSFPKKQLMAFISDVGNIVYIPLSDNLSRLVVIGMPPSGNQPPNLKAIEDFCARITRTKIQLSQPVWLAAFYLHHRAVEQYSKQRAFLVGDAAHIHSPVAAQGMNTGLQDATNLAWKLALVLNYNAPKALIETYQMERQPVGKKLVNTTDRLFGILTKKDFISSMLRQYIMPLVMNLVTKSAKIRKKFFLFISELAIYYQKNSFIKESIQGADAKFLAGPQAGHRAPDAPVNQTSLFEIFQRKPFNALLFQIAPSPVLNQLKNLYPSLIAINEFMPSDHSILFDRYGVNGSAIYFIRPDGYIGFRSFGSEVEDLLRYLKKIFQNSEN